jgi:hypothetical protein
MYENTGARVIFCEEEKLRKHYEQESIRIHQLIKKMTAQFLWFTSSYPTNIQSNT